MYWSENPSDFKPQKFYTIPLYLIVVNSNMNNMKNFYFKLSTLVVIILCTYQTPLYSQEHSFDSLLIENRYEIDLKDGLYSGTGLNFLMNEAENSSFFSICEEHNLLELNEISSFLFEKFNKMYNYNYLVLEQGVAISSLLGSEANRKSFDAVADVARRYPQSPTFATDEELKLISDVGMVSKSSTNPIWGIDQDLGGLHILERLVGLAPNKLAKAKAKELSNLARHYEMDRINGDTLFMAMVATPELFAQLNELFKPMPSSETEWLIEALQRSTRIYYNNYLGRKGKPTSYESGRERENSMKLRFMENYNKAENAGAEDIKAFVKMGHYHLLRGIYKLNVPTFGNFLSEFAISKNANSFLISSYTFGSPDKYRNIGGPLVEAASKKKFTIYDLRPLRPYAHQGSIKDLSDYYKQLIFSADAVLIIREGHTGSYDIVKSAIKN